MLNYLKPTFLFIVILFVSCQNKENKPAPSTNNADLSGYNITEYEEGLVAGVVGKSAPFTGQGLIVDGKKEGFWATFHDRNPAKIKSISMYIDGERNGPHYEFSINGMTKKIAHFKNGSLNGDYKEYKYNSIKEHANMKNGEYHGVREVYFGDIDNKGKLQQKINYTDGVQDGKMEWYNPEGEVVQEFMYENGKRIDG